MTAEIIPFGEQQRSRSRQQPLQRCIPSPEQRITDPDMQLLAGQERLGKTVLKGVVSVRCLVDSKQYEVCFYRARVWEVLGIHYRKPNKDGRVVELKFRHWHAAHFFCPRDLDTRVVEAARRELRQNGAERLRRLDNEAAIARLQARHAGLLRQAEKVEATIALMEREVQPP